MADMFFDEEGLLDEPCLSCDKSYIEDIWHEWCCDEKECPYKAKSEDCRNCKRWNECPCGKEGHTNGTSIGYSIGECKDYEPCEESINKDELYKAIDELKTICGTGTIEKAVTENNINWLKWKIDKLLSDALKEAYIKGYDYGVKDWFKAKTKKPDIKAESEEEK